MKYKVGDRVRIKPTLNTDDTTPDCWVSAKMIIKRGQIYPIVKITSCGLYGLDLDNNKEDCWWFTEEMLEPVDSKTLRMADGTIIGEFATGGTLPTSEWSKLIFKNGSSIEALPQKDDTVRGENHFCNGFRGDKISSDLIVSHTEMERAMDMLLKALEKPSVKFGIKKLEQKLKEEKNLKFTFYVTEGTRPDKKRNGLIPTMTTTVVDASGKKATVTCDKADYSERQGVLEAIVQMACGGNFDKEYDKAVKKNKLIELHDRTCTYCGKVFDTVEELKAHEAWHVERKKARRERYLLRKRAKEIAFEEQAQKLAKEMIKENK